ncbi:MAG: hypothetical protein PHO16_06810 [Candidatus Cloacimonetes bacterium]|nr:hypothetical protein [Candidatus Cloacimonadota bacterium]
MLKCLWLCILVALMSVGVHAASLIFDEDIRLEPEQMQYQLSQTDIIVHSESIRADSLALLPDIDYKMNYKSGTLSLLRLPNSATLRITYLVLPPELKAPVFRYESFSYTDSSRITLAKSNPLMSGSKLQINGSKTFALSLSETGETDLLQSLYVNLSGELSKNIEIEAQLSDSQSKLSPEGDSKELSSLDQVFIRVSAPKWEVGMGDLDFTFENSRYLSYRTKLEGIALRYFANAQAQLAYSAGSGKRASYTIPIIDGKQGPYYLVANDNQRSFLIVAGSEEIYLDGTLLHRGEDYAIDYSEGSVMFRILVSSSNIINASFQYSEENFPQSSYFSSSQIPVNEHLKLSHHFIFQKDTKDQGLLYSLSEADLDSLRAAGDNEVFGSGIIPSNPGEGSYIQLSTPDGEIYYEYAYGDSLADYNIIFSYVGSGNGEYLEYSIGKYRFVGEGMGTHLAIKRLVAPVQRSNLEVGLAWENGGWNSGVDAIYSHNDQNTWSKLDDNDNSGGIISAYLGLDDPEIPLTLQLFGEHRLDDTYRFSSEGSPEHDFATLIQADSLAQSTIDLSLAYKSSVWQPQVLLRWRKLAEQYSQKAIRWNSRTEAYWLLPASFWQSTISEQDGDQASLLQYHNLELLWVYKVLNLKMLGLLNQMENKHDLDTQYYKMQPSIGLSADNYFTELTFIRDKSSLRTGHWIEVNSSDTYQIKHSSNFSNHSMDLDFNHRELNNPHSIENPKSSYDLLQLRSSHRFLNSAISLFNNYQLNQTEFFPKIRDLVYVGHGLGVYDSTGVMVDGGDYNYEYITSTKGTLSTEITALSSIYLKPALYWPNTIWQKVQSDLTLNGTEQLDKQPDLGNIFFLPEHSFNSESTIYARQSYLHNFWFDLYKSRMIANLNWEINRDLDQRYQDTQKSLERILGMKLDMKGFAGVNNRLELISEETEESRYDSRISRQTLINSIEKKFTSSSTAQIELSISQEKGKKQNAGDQDYRLQSVSISPSLRSVLLQKYRVSGSISLGYNDRKGTDFLSFLPQKREGVVSDGQLSMIYRVNSISTFSLEYRFTKYPHTKDTHNLKLEFKAEL